MTPTAKRFVEIESSPILSRLAVSSLDITEPVSCNIDCGSQETDSDPCKDKHQPNVACIQKLSSVPDDANTSGKQLLETLSLFRVFEDPVNRRQVIVTNSAARPPEAIEPQLTLSTYKIYKFRPFRVRAKRTRGGITDDGYAPDRWC